MEKMHSKYTPEKTRLQYKINDTDDLFENVFCHHKQKTLIKHIPLFTEILCKKWYSFQKNTPFLTMWKEMNLQLFDIF